MIKFEILLPRKSPAIRQLGCIRPQKGMPHDFPPKHRPEGAGIGDHLLRCFNYTVGRLFSRATNFANRLKKVRGNNFHETAFEACAACVFTYYNTCVCYKPEINQRLANCLLKFLNVFVTPNSAAFCLFGLFPSLYYSGTAFVSWNHLVGHRLNPLLPCSPRVAQSNGTRAPLPIPRRYAPL